MSTLPKFTMRELLDAGVHFGHKTMRWNPRMAPYIYGDRNNIHIIDLQKTVPLLHRALETVHQVAARNGRILFVSTKRQAAPAVAQAAARCGQYYVNHRWLGGMLTNWGTVSQSIKTMHNLQAQLDDPEATINKKERLQIQRQVIKLELSLGGIKDMGGTPDLIFVIDTNKEHISIKEANKLGIPVVAIADTNSNPDGIDYIIPGNDDAIRSIELYCNLVADTILSGMSQAATRSGSDIGASTKTPAEALPSKKEDKAKAKPAEDKKKTATKAPAKEEKAPTKEAKTDAKEAKAKPAAKKAATKAPTKEEKAPAKEAKTDAKEAKAKPAAKKAATKKDAGDDTSAKAATA